MSYTLKGKSVLVWGFEMDNSKQQDVPLYSALEKFRRLRVVPFDVPGHKRGRGNKGLVDFLGQQCVEIDVNSMKPLDNLCHPVSVIKDFLQRSVGKNDHRRKIRTRGVNADLCKRVLRHQFLYHDSVEIYDNHACRRNYYSEKTDLKQLVRHFFIDKREIGPQEKLTVNYQCHKHIQKYQTVARNVQIHKLMVIHSIENKCDNEYQRQNPQHNFFLQNAPSCVIQCFCISI